MMLNVINHIPVGLLQVTLRDLYRILPGPTLMHLSGRRPEPLFVSVILHGNEGAGFRAIQAILNKYSGHELPRALSVFFGNITAAREGVRRLADQPDYNRIWPGAETTTLPENKMACTVIEELRGRHIFAAIDIHNNTGFNPHYACVNRLDQPFLHLARLFSRTVVFFERPLGVISSALAELCPAVVIECGKPDNTCGDEEAAEFIEAGLRLSEFPVHDLPASDIDLYHTIGIVTVPPDVGIGPTQTGPYVQFADNIDHLNFHDLPTGTHLAHVQGTSVVPLVVTDDEGSTITDEYLELRRGEIITRRGIMPAMLTVDERIIRQDCLCYFMERLGHPAE
jgi:hypothetical protein